MMSTQYSCSPTRNEISSRVSVLDVVLASVIGLFRGDEGGVGGERRTAAAQVDHRVDVEDQSHPAVAQDGRGGDPFDLLVVLLRAT